MKYKLIITEEAKIDIASFLRSGDKAEAKKVSALLDELREHPYTVQVNRKFCGVFARKMFYRLPAVFTNREIWCFLFRGNTSSRESSVW